MTRDNLADELDGLVPTPPEASGWGPKVRTEHRRRRVRTSGVVAGAAAVAVVGVGMLLLNVPQPTILATPAESTTEPAEATPTSEPSVTACADRVEWKQTVAVLPDVTGAFFCVSENPGGTSFVQVAFSSDLTVDIVSELQMNAFLLGLLPGISATNAHGLALRTAAGDVRSLVGSVEDGRFNWYEPTGEGLMEWRPSPELLERMRSEIVATGHCVRPPRQTTADVQVHVYSAGGDDTAVAAAAAHLRQAGFAVTVTGEKALKSLGGPIILRGSNQHREIELVGTWFGGGGGELSRNDAIVDVLVTEEFTADALHQGQPDQPIGDITCSPTSDDE
ncbi:hypothetical protein [Tessaracoccus sp. Z1128]